jgi:hypothetical protein
MFPDDNDDDDDDDDTKTKFHRNTFYQFRRRLMRTDSGYKQILLIKLSFSALCAKNGYTNVK